MAKQATSTGKARRTGWEIDFARWVEEALRTPFQWGIFDCGLMAADAVRVLTGTDPASDLRGAYSTSEGASLALGGTSEGLDFKELQEFCNERLGESVPPAMARKGDIVLGEFGEKETYSLMVDNGTTYLVMDRTAVLVPKQQIRAIACWRIG